jgi:myo-inositol 2-dehydrogenase/D-chiro-inositol 1-dehydrogenase
MSTPKKKDQLSRRTFVAGAAAAGISAPMIVSPNVLGGQNKPAPSDEFGGALIGCGGRGGGTFKCLGPNVKMLAQCDVKFKDKADDKTFYTDFRRVLERDDIDVVAIATHPGWHALISIAAMEAGKDVVCEKPMCRFISEGRAVADAEKRYGRVFQIEKKGGYKPTKTRKIFESGLLKDCDAVYVRSGGFKVKNWSGKVAYSIKDVPSNLDWDMYCGPAPQRPFNSHRNGGSHRGYWDYEGGGLGDMAHHQLHDICYQYGRDLTAPVEVVPHAPLSHPEACGLWGWVELKYADGFALVLESGEWGDRYDRLKSQNTSEGDLFSKLSKEDQQKVEAMPEPERLPFFPEAIRTRQKTASHAERSHRVAMIYHLANVAFRCGRPLRFDPETEQIVGDEQANRLVNQPMRAPWRL